MAAAATQCQIELQVADARSGRNLSSQRFPRAMAIRRRGGLELASDEPPMRKALKLQVHDYEVYSSHVGLGKLTFIRRDAGRISQFNLHDGEPAAMQRLLEFVLRSGATSKTRSPRSRPPMLTRVVATSLAKQQRANEMLSPPIASTGVKRQRSPLVDLTNGGSPKAEPRHKTRRVLLSDRPAAQPSESRERLTTEQKAVLKLVAQRKNVFFTGSAGSGKSFLLQYLLRHGCGHAMGKVYVTAPTGVAAYNVGGMTLHHFAGMDTQPYANQRELLHEIQRKPDAVSRWKQAQALVIDEVSMLDGQLFDDLEAIARALRRSKAFFGGIQLILSGDFFQLPPVSRQRQHAKLCFESSAWGQGIDAVVVLKEVFRQRQGEFVEILNAFRTGNPSREMVDAINQRYLPEGDEGEDAIRIFTHNDDVLQTNTKRLEDLGGKKFNYIAADRGKPEYLAGCPSPRVLSLKKHAQVMLTKTISAASGLVNGCRGVVQGFTSQTNLPIVKFSSGATEIVRHEEFSVRVGDATLAARRQLPLTLAWAISIHKSQGLAFDAAVLDLSRAFEFGQAYVALSRVRSLEGLFLRRKLPTGRVGIVLADPRVLEFYEAISSC